MLRPLFLLACIALTGAAPAAELPVPLRQFSAGLDSLDGRFTQQTFGPNGEAQEASTGRVALKAPNRFRWDYEVPFAQSIIADGDRIWVYDPELEQASVKPQAEAEQDTPLAALLDPDALARQFEVADDGEADGLRWISLRPRNPEAGIGQARLGFVDGELRAMQLVDSLQQRSELRFSDWQRNTPVDAARFRFVPPEGVDVVGEMGDIAEVLALPEE